MDISEDKNSDSIATFYDTFGKRGIDDYVKGNRRIERAIELVARYISPESRQLLDVGCGIGIACSALSERFPQLRFTGVDISPENIAAARSLFASDRVSFEVSKVTDDVLQGEYDLIYLLDVFEHIPRDVRRSFQQHLAAHLASQGTLVATVPSPLLQAHLRDHDPSELQIVDEIVTLEDVRQFAEVLGGEVVHFSYANIWRTNDYLHFAISRSPSLKPLRRAKASGWQRLRDKLSERWGTRQRRRRIEAAMKR